MKIKVTVECEAHEIKELRKYPSLTNVRINLPKAWNYDMVKVIEIDDYIMKMIDGKTFFELELNGEIVEREVKFDKTLERPYVYVPKKFDKKQVLIVPYHF